MSKISREALTDAIKAILKNSNETKKRGFLETIDLQISLKNYDPVKDKRFSGVFRLPVIPRPKYSVCILGDAKHEGEAKANKLPVLTADDLKKLNKNKKSYQKTRRHVRRVFGFGVFDSSNPAYYGSRFEQSR